METEGLKKGQRSTRMWWRRETGRSTRRTQEGDNEELDGREQKMTRRGIEEEGVERKEMRGAGAETEAGRVGGSGEGGEAGGAEVSRALAEVRRGRRRRASERQEKQRPRSTRRSYR